MFELYFKKIEDLLYTVEHNHIEAGDALMRHHGADASFGPGSTIIGTAIVKELLLKRLG